MEYFLSTHQHCRITPSSIQIQTNRLVSVWWQLDSSLHIITWNVTNISKYLSITLIKVPKLTGIFQLSNYFFPFNVYINNTSTWFCRNCQECYVNKTFFSHYWVSCSENLRTAKKQFLNSILELDYED